MILWLNEKYIKEGFDHKNLREATVKYCSDNRRHRCELVEEPKNNLIEILWTKNKQSE